MKNCEICGKPYMPYRSTNRFCNSKECKKKGTNGRARKYRVENPELARKNSKEYFNRKMQSEKFRQELREKERNRYHKRKSLVFDHYGWKCACCGESIPEFLTIDHIADNGAVHRKQINGMALYYWLVRNHFPDGFQTLCWNCNCAKGKHGGHCPHENMKLEVVV